MEGSPDDPQEDLNDGHDASGDSSDASKEDTITNGRAENASNAETEHGDPEALHKLTRLRTIQQRLPHRKVLLLLKISL